jgi:hypothetical protein
MPNWENTTHTGVSRGLIADECDNAMQLSDTWLSDHDKAVEVKVLEEVLGLTDMRWGTSVTDFRFMLRGMIESRKSISSDTLPLKHDAELNGLCTVLDAARIMYKKKADVLKMRFLSEGKIFNIELRIAQVE